MKFFISKIKYINFNSLIFNFVYFDFKTVVKLPVLIASNVVLKNLKGTLILNLPIKTGMIKIGYGDISIFDKKRTRTIWSKKGKIIFNGRAFIGHGSKISCGLNGNISFGDNFTITAESSMVSNCNVQFGNNCLVSWENIIMDDDFHSIYNSNG